MNQIHGNSSKQTVLVGQR